MLRYLGRIGCAAVLCGVLLHGAGAVAADELTQYRDAVGQKDLGQRIRATEQFLAAQPESRLKYDALETLIWDCIQTNQSEKAARYADALLKVDSSNALALAVQSDRPVPATKERKGQSSFTSAQQGIASYTRLQLPAGMDTGEFALLRRYVAATLSGQAGLGYLEHKEYETARDYLRQAVAGAPNDPRYVYGLALALLSGKKADPKEGYWQLARAVALSAGSESGTRIADYARRSYTKAGGNSRDWDAFLAAAEHEMPERQRTQTAVAANRPSATSEKERKAETKTTAVATPPSPALIPAPAFQREQVPRDAPLSLGIVIQSSHLSRENRQVLTSALIDMLRRLRQDDEAFIIAFSDKLDFEEDLTGSDKKLEQAIQQIQPSSGAALYDAVEFAAGHLERIGRNKNRVLLLISDGRNTKQSSAPQLFTSELTHVRVNCIGMHPDNADDRKRLVALASYSGGVAEFVSGPEQIRAATRQVAQTMGIGFPE